MENHKKILLLVISLIIGFMVVGCSDNDSPEIPQVPINFTINVTDVTSNSAKVTVTPSNTDIYYFCKVVRSEMLKGLDYAGIIRLLSSPNTMITPSKGTSVFTPDTLAANMDYTAVVFMKDEFSTPKAYRAEFKTTEIPAKDLGKGANCYIVPEAGKYSFVPLHVSGKPIANIDKVDWIWSTKVGESNEQKLLKNVSFDGERVLLDATGERGSIILAAFDTTGKIVWVWHIWCTEIPKTMKYENGKVFMDRNLGALSADPADGKKTWGLLWQWGRIVPFFGGYEETEWNKADAFNESRKWTILNPKYGLEWKFEYHAVNIDEAIAQPTMFFCDPKSCDWNNTINLKLWGAVKTDYDPSPAGYHVPQTSDWEEPLEKLVAKEDLSGATYTFEGNTAWWPASGSGREFDSGCNIIGRGGVFVWSSTAEYVTDPFFGMDNSPIAFRLAFQLDPRFLTVKAMGNRAFAHSIRCVAD
ncbi:hypothetical protein [Barnesiella intestinihominis]|uniref:hypothetical protein n=1 Tax=Barnesiella intestinihominis TaxID=487174 RepID=UPI003AB67EE3